MRLHGRPWVALVAAAALGSALALAPAAAASTGTDDGVPVEVQTYNMDLGGDLSLLFAGGDLLTATSAVWADTIASNIPARAAAVAKVIAVRQPDIVGLNEVALWTEAPAAIDAATGMPYPTGAFTTRFDGLQSLLAALRALGTPYRVVISGQTFGTATPLPVVEGTSLKLVAFSDYNVLLIRKKSARQGMTYSGATSTTYQAALPVTVAGQTLYVTRGWVQADVGFKGRTFRVANTHLEAWGIPGTLKDQVRNPQAMELAYNLAASPYPVVLLGDMNSRPTMCAEYRPGSEEYPLDQNIVAYGILQSAGLTEVWPVTHPTDPCGPAGWTSGNRELDGLASAQTHRIDDVFFSDGVTALQAVVDGDDLADRTPGGLWPSDHSTTWAKLLVRSS